MKGLEIGKIGPQMEPIMMKMTVIVTIKKIIHHSHLGLKAQTRIGTVDILLIDLPAINQIYLIHPIILEI